MSPALSSLSLLRRKASSGIFHARTLLGLGALPNALVIGAQKSGTTTLFHYLAQHPQICPSRTKEPQYFDREFFRGENWYRAHFRPKRGQTIRLEASPHSIFHPLSARRIHLAIPDAKLIVVLRNPVDRALSHYHQSIVLAEETLPFREALAAEPARIAGCYEKIERGEAENSRDLRVFSYVTRGLYAAQIKRWLTLFPREQFLFLRAEDLFDAPQQTLLGVHAFLGVDPLPISDLRAQNRRSYPPMEEDVRLSLEGIFRAPNLELARLTGIKWD